MKAWSKEEEDFVKQEIKSNPNESVRHMAKRLSRNAYLNRSFRAIRYKISDMKKRYCDMDYANVSDVVSGRIKALKPIKFKPIARSKTKKVACIKALISDMQYGTCFDARDTSGINNFDSKIFAEEVNVYIEQLKNIIEEVKKNHYVPIMAVSLLGDMVEGEDIFKTQRNYIDRIIVDQVCEVVEILAGILIELTKYVPEIRVYCVAGNHGRISKEHHFRDNFDYLVYKMLYKWLEAYDNLNMFIGTHCMIYRIPSVPDWLWLDAHGDNIRSYHKIPYYGMEQASLKYTSLAGEDINYISIGHHHKSTSLTTPAGEIFMNGSWTGGSPLAINKFIDTATAVQKVLIVDPECGVVQNRSIVLQKPRKITMDKNLVYTSYE